MKRKMKISFTQFEVFINVQVGEKGNHQDTRKHNVIFSFEK